VLKGGRGVSITQQGRNSFIQPGGREEKKRSFLKEREGKGKNRSLVRVQKGGVALTAAHKRGEKGGGENTLTEKRRTQTKREKYGHPQKNEKEKAHAHLKGRQKEKRGRYLQIVRRSVEQMR